MNVKGHSYNSNRLELAPKTTKSASMCVFALGACWYRVLSVSRQAISAAPFERTVHVANVFKVTKSTNMDESKPCSNTAKKVRHTINICIEHA
jgi:predicted alpha/beta hydrolase